MSCFILYISFEYSPLKSQTTFDPDPNVPIFVDHLSFRRRYKCLSAIWIICWKGVKGKKRNKRNKRIKEKDKDTIFKSSSTSSSWKNYIGDDLHPSIKIIEKKCFSFYSFSSSEIFRLKILFPFLSLKFHGSAKNEHLRWENRDWLFQFRVSHD